jgi:hypothetical protein
MAGFWPLYSDFSSHAQVTLALPGIPSTISQSVGGNSPALLLVPNVDFLTAFIQGNIGIADSISNAALLKNINGPIASNNEMVTRHFSKVNKLGLENKLDSFKDSKGKIKIPKSEIKLSSENDSLGFKAMEKTILQSIFETQKPYMEIAKMVVDVLVSVEDVIARVMPLLSASPLTFKSDKPVGNAGAGKRSKAIGYQGGKDIKEALAALDKMTKIGGKLDVNKDGTFNRNVTTPTTTPDEVSDLSISQNDNLKSTGKDYKIIDIKYSTGDYDPSVDYLYTYINLPADDNINNIQPTPETDESDPYDKYKPKRIILGIFNSKGVPLDPNSKLKTIGFSGDVETNFKKADWITKSPKWVFPKSTSPNAIVWPSFGTPIYTWERFGGVDQVDSKTQPSSKDPAPSYKLKKYKKGDKNKLSGFDAIEGDPVISGFDTSEINTYSTYFSEYTKTNMNLSKDLTDAEKKEYSDMIIKQVNVLSHLENVNLYGQAKTSVYKDFNVPDGMKISFMPMQITIPEAINDPKLAGLNGKIWIDPESDYETKIIQVKPTTKIAYSGSKDEPSVEVDIKSFVKNKATFKFSNNQKFNIDIKNNGILSESFVDTDQYTLENWNYNPSTKKILPNNFIEIFIWSKNPGGKLGDYFKQNNKIVMGRDNAYNKHGDYEIVITNKNGIYSYTENKYNNTTTKDSTPKSFVNGVKMLGDGTLVKVENQIITKWYFLYNKVYNISNLPGFGKESIITLNLNSLSKKNVNQAPNSIKYYYEPNSTEVSNNIPLYQIKVSNPSFPYGKIIDPSKILNEHLTKDELYSTGKYGSSSIDDPQQLGVVYRYALTDLDEETYYIIEGIRTEDNVQIDNNGGDRAGSSKNASATSGNGGGAYRLPHAIGAITVFIKMLVKVFSKLIPSITKLLKLFKNPMGFVTDIIMQKLGDSFSIFSPEAIKKFDTAKDLSSKKKEFTKPTPNSPKMGDYVNMMKDHFKNSKLSNHVAVDSLGNFKDASGKLPKTPPKDSVGNFKFVADGIGFIPFNIFGKDLSFGMELKMANIITKEWGNPLPMRLIFNKDKNSNDSNLNVSAPGMDDGNNNNSKDSSKNKVDTNSNNNSKSPQGKDGSTNPNKRYVTLSTWYSTGEFINGVDYKYIYINQEDESLLDEVDKLSNSIDPADLQNAKRKLEDAIVKNPDDDALKNKLDEIKKKMFDLNSNTQPLLKMILGMVTLPIKVISGVVQWIMDFFKSLTNPMALPGKIIEFLSFKWIMDFFSPKGLLKMAGIEFDPSLLPQWASQANMTKVMNINKPDVTKTEKIKDISPNDAKALAQEKTSKLPKGVPNHKGSYALPDDFELADLSKFLSVSFLGQLPTYTAKDIRDQPKFPMKLLMPIICFIEKLINGFIDFVWSTLGIECIIPPPHIKLCSSNDPDSMDPTELGKILNGETPGSTSSNTVDFKTDVLATNPDFASQTPLEKFVYEVKLDNGEVIRLTDKESLDKFIEEHKDLGFDFQF